MLPRQRIYYALALTLGGISAVLMTVTMLYTPYTFEREVEPLLEIPPVLIRRP